MRVCIGMNYGRLRIKERVCKGLSFFMVALLNYGSMGSDRVYSWWAWLTSSIRLHLGLFIPIYLKLLAVTSKHIRSRPHRHPPLSSSSSL
jgi:hypothetical protein